MLIENIQEEDSRRWSFC